MPCPTLELCDDLAAALNTAWGPTGDNAVERCYFKRIGDADSGNDQLAGRKVFIFPTEYEFAADTRAEDVYTHRVSVLTVERHADAGDPPTAWTDARVEFVHTYVAKGFDFARAAPSWNPYLTTVSAKVQACDVEKLTSAGKLFYALVEFEFAESVAV